MICSSVVCTQNTIFLGYTSSSSNVIIYSNLKSHNSEYNLNEVIDSNSSPEKPSIRPFVYIGQYLNFVGPPKLMKLNKTSDRLLVITISGHLTILDSSPEMLEQIRLLFQDHEYKRDYMPESKRIGVIYHYKPNFLGEVYFASFLEDHYSVIGLFLFYLATGWNFSDGFYIFSPNDSISGYKKESAGFPTHEVESFGHITNIAASNDCTCIALSSSNSYLLIFDRVKNSVIYLEKMSEIHTQITSLDWKPKGVNSSHISLAIALFNGLIKIVVFNYKDGDLEFDTVLQYKVLELGSIKKILYKEYDLLISTIGNCLFDDKVVRDDFSLDSNQWQFSGINHPVDVNQTVAQCGIIIQQWKDGKTSLERLSGHLHQEHVLDFCYSGNLIISCSKNTVIASLDKLVFTINP